jgi:hypothetical protein
MTQTPPTDPLRRHMAYLRQTGKATLTPRQLRRVTKKYNRAVYGGPKIEQPKED